MNTTIKKSGKTHSRLDNRLLFQEYLNGEPDALEKIITNNMAFIKSIALTYKFRMRGLELEDLINEGVCGFIKAVENYNPEIGELTTYAMSWVNSYINKAVSKNFDILHESADFLSNAYKLSQILNRCKMDNLPMPTDEELKRELKVSTKSLYNLKEYVNAKILSIDAPLQDDSKTTQEEVVGTKELRYSYLENDMADKTLMIFLKETLSPAYYYVIYYRILISPKVTHKRLAFELGLSRPRIEQIEKAILKKLKKEYMHHDELVYPKPTLNNREQEIYNTNPINPRSIARYMYLVSVLTPYERKLYSLYIKRKFNYSLDYYARVLKVKDHDIVKLGESIKKHITSMNQERFEKFRLAVTKKYQSELLTLDLDDIEEIISNFNENDEEPLMDKEDAERELNLVVFGYKRNINLSKGKLFNTLISHLDLFKEEEILFLKAYYFDMAKKTDFKDRFRGVYLNLNDLLLKLERLYYNVPSFFRKKFSKERYYYIKSHFKDAISPCDIRLLNALYEGHSYEELSIIYCVSITRIEEMIEDAKNRLNDLYLMDGIDKGHLYKDVYLKAINDGLIKLNPFDQSLAVLYFQGRDVKEIAKLMGLSIKNTKKKINYIVNKIDLYRFGLVKSSRYSKDEKLEALKKLNLSENEKNIGLLLIEDNDLNKIATEYGYPLDEVNRVSHNLCRMTRINKDNTTDITYKDVLDDLTSHPSEKILTGKYEEIMSYIYGIKSTYNEEGKTYTNDEIRDKMGINSNQFYQIVKRAKALLIRRKLSVRDKSFLYMPREKVENMLKDKHLPISKKERETLELLYGINRESLHPKEIASYFKETEGSLRKRVQCAVIDIYKYMNREIPGLIIYEDIASFVKFFPKFEKRIILFYYRDELTVSDIADELGISSNQVSLTLKRITLLLKDYQNGLIKGFDYDFMYENLSCDDVPYFGDVALANRLIHLFIDKGLGYDAICEKVQLPYKKTLLAKQIEIILCAISKKKDGIVKPREYSYEEVRGYYLANKDDMPLEKKASYYDYFERQKNNYLFSSTPLISDEICYDILRSEHTRLIILDDLTKEDVTSLIAKYKRHLSRNCLAYLINTFMGQEEKENAKSI